MSKKLNIDILNQIVKYIDIDSIETACRCLVHSISKEEIKSIIRYRQNPMLLLKRLVDEPEVLLLGMGFAGVLLSGSQATEYFYPGIVSKGSDWDFYCPSSYILVHKFETFMEGMGVKWIRRIDANEDIGNRDGNPYYNLDTTIGKVKHNNVVHTVQLIRDSKRNGNAFNLIVQFHSSIVQCFISAYGAVCMYSNLTMRGRSIAWDSRVGSSEEKENGQKARSKYISRGIKYTSYEWYMNVEQDIQNHYISIDIVDTIQRKIGDDRSRVIPFNCYYDEGIKYLNILYDRGETELSVFQGLDWLQNPYRCTTTIHHGPILCIPDKLTLETLAKLYNLYPKLLIILKLQKAGRMLPDDPIRLQSMMDTFSNLRLDIV